MFTVDVMRQQLTTARPESLHLAKAMIGSQDYAVRLDGRLVPVEILRVEGGRVAISIEGERRYATLYAWFATRIVAYVWNAQHTTADHGSFGTELVRRDGAEFSEALLAAARRVRLEEWLASCHASHAARAAYAQITAA